MFYRRYGKRITDIVGSVVGFVLLWPILVVAAALVRAHFGEPVLFRQLRPGLHGKLFTIYKLRTMRADAHPNDARPDEVRLTRLGRFLRSTSVDELPEFWNVLRGDMSLVGPRPLLPQYLPRYTDRQARRHEVKPGLTGWAQVNGRNALDWKSKLELDVWYVEHASCLLDITILWRTAGHILRRRGINHPESATAPEFIGTNRGI